MTLNKHCIRREPQLQYYMDDNRCTDVQRSTDDVLMSNDPQMMCSTISRLTLTLYNNN